MTTYLDFEKPIAELESKIAELRHLPNSGDVDIAEEVMRLQDRVQKQLRATYAKLTPWQRVLVARHPSRPGIEDFFRNFEPQQPREEAQEASGTGFIVSSDGVSVDMANATANPRYIAPWRMAERCAITRWREAVGPAIRSRESGMPSANP